MSPLISGAELLLRGSELWSPGDLLQRGPTVAELTEIVSSGAYERHSGAAARF